MSKDILCRVGQFGSHIHLAHPISVTTHCGMWCRFHAKHFAIAEHHVVTTARKNGGKHLCKKCFPDGLVSLENYLQGAAFT